MLLKGETAILFPASESRLVCKWSGAKCMLRDEPISAERNSGFHNN
jgi:hypothetical protein